jgi:hypothetical protein
VFAREPAADAGQAPNSAPPNITALPFVFADRNRALLGLSGTF